MNNSASEQSSLSNNNEEQNASQQSAKKSNETNKTGQPKGTTVFLSLDLKKCKAQAINYAKSEWNKEKKEAELVGRKVQCGA